MEREVVKALRPLGLLAMVATLASCPGYSPTLTDCTLKCGPNNLCPTGLVCKATFCRPPNADGSCDCKPGEQRACGGGKGTCNPGVQTCTNNGAWGACIGEGKPTPELCDLKDNDCNGTVDDNVTDAPPCPFTRGVCVGHNQACVSGTYDGTCALSDYGPNYEQVETKCDGLDNDCDGVTDGTNAQVLATSITSYALAEFDGGFSLVGNEALDDGGNRVILVPLTAGLQPRAPTVVVSPSFPQELVLDARANSGGITFVAWSPVGVDAGVHLTTVAYNGAINNLPTYDKSERTVDELSLGVGPTSAMVTWVAHNRQVVRVVTWDLGSTNYVAKDYGTFPDGGYVDWNEFYHGRLSANARAFAYDGYDNDAGNDLNYETMLVGPPKTGAFYVGGPLVELSNGSLQSGWSYSSYFQFFGFFTENESGMNFKNDVFTANLGTVRRVPDYQAIADGAIGRGLFTSVLGWTERGQSLVLGTPYGNGNQARLRFLYGDGGFFFAPHIGNPLTGQGLLGITWRDTISGAGTISGQMVCQP